MSKRRTFNDRQYVRPRKTKKHNSWLWKSGRRSCEYCGVKLTRETITTDHVVPLSARGYDKRKNVVSCCYLCNQAKGRMNPTLFKSLMNEAKAVGQVPQLRSRIIAERTVW